MGGVVIDNIAAFQLKNLLLLICIQSTTGPFSTNTKFLQNCGEASENGPVAKQKEMGIC